MHTRQVRQDRSDGECDEQAESCERLRAVLAPGYPCHRSGTPSVGRDGGSCSGAM